MTRNSWCPPGSGRAKESQEPHNRRLGSTQRQSQLSYGQNSFAVEVRIVATSDCRHDNTRWPISRNAHEGPGARSTWRQRSPPWRCARPARFKKIMRNQKSILKWQPGHLKNTGDSTLRNRKHAFRQKHPDCAQVGHIGSYCHLKCVGILRAQINRSEQRVGDSRNNKTERKSRSANLEEKS